MEWGQVIALIAVNVTLSGIMIGLFMMNRNDMTSYRADAAADRRDLLQISRNIQQEIKDFHGRLCAIEERNKNANR